MKALITAGGRGTRLRPITHTINKHLIPLVNKPMIFYVLEKMRDAGIRDVLINVNPGEQELQKVIGAGGQWGLNVQYVEQTGGPKGLAHILKIAKPFIAQEPFVFYLGDNIFVGDIAPFINKFESGGYNSVLVLSKVRDPQRFGVPELKDGKIIRIEEKPTNPKSDFAVTGIYIYDHNVFKSLEHIKPSQRGELEISDVNTWLIENGYNMGFEEVTGWWKDTGTAQDLIEGNALILSQIKDSEINGAIDTDAKINGIVKIGAGTKIDKDTVIAGPVVIGNNCDIKHSYIGPFSAVGNNVEIKNSEIEHSIILNDVRIASIGKRIVDSLIGAGAELSSRDIGAPEKPHKLIIGNNSIIEL